MQPKLTESQRQQELSDTLEELRQDILMLRLMLRGLEGRCEDLPLQCLARMGDYLDQHIRDVRVLCSQKAVTPPPQ